MTISRIAWVAAAAAVVAAGRGEAQTTPDKALDRAESRLDRIDVERTRGTSAMMVDPAAQEPAKVTFDLELSLPLTFNSNVALSETDPDSAFHADPGATIRVNVPGENVKLTLEASADIDQYSRHDENDGSTFIGKAVLGFPKVSIAGFRPSLSYSLTSVYEQEFGDHVVTSHNFALAAARKFEFKEERSLTVLLQLLRREAGLASVEQNRALVSVTYKLPLAAGIGASAGVTAFRAHYTGGMAEGRDDTNLKFAIGISRDLGAGFALEVAAFFQRNWSDRTGKDYSVFDAGPSLGFSKSF